MSRVPLSRRVGIALVVGLVLANVVLVAAVLRAREAAEMPDAAEGVPTSQPTPTAASESPAIQEVEPRSASVPVRWMVDIAPDLLALRARSGTCGTEAGLVERSDDGGQSWQSVTPEGTVVVNRVRALGDLEGWIVGGGSDCDADFLQTSDGGATWRTTGGTGGTWFRLAEDSLLVHAPDGVVEGPCDDGGTIVDAQAVDAQLGAVLCSDGSVFRADASGRDWSPYGVVPGGTSLSFSGTDEGFAAGGADGCEGVQVFHASDGSDGSWAPVGCAVGADLAGAAVAVRDGVGVLVSDAGTWRSEDSGETWQPAR